MVSRATHAVGGLFFAWVFGLNPVYALAGALIPDLDYPFRSLHRKLLHNVWLVGLLYFVGGPAPAVGALSHLVLDSLTPRGVNWFWPVPFPRVRGPISTGSFWDYALAGVMFSIIVLWTYVL